MKPRQTAVTSLLVLCCSLAATFAEQPPVEVLFPGNWADPTIVKAGRFYYFTANNDGYVPSVLVFRSSDLRRWKPLCYACPTDPQYPATDITLYDQTLYIYGGGGRNPWVTYAQAPYTAWSPRINIQPKAPHGIDAGHVTDQTGNRFLYTNQGKIVEMSRDGLVALTRPRKVYDPWPIPEDLAVECVCLESPKLFKYNGWFYMVSAQGGTAGPATSHMAVVARARTVTGPWRNSPHNPLIWTRDVAEQWWSKGHATLIEGPDENWYAIYHGYRNGLRTLGRSTLISPVEWTDDGWPVLAADWPEGWHDVPISINLPLSDEFDSPKLAMQWQSLGVFQPARYTLRNGTLEIQAEAQEPGSSHPLTVNPRDEAYEVETELTIEGQVSAGLILFYCPAGYTSLGLSHTGRVEKLLKKSHATALSPERNTRSYHHKTIRLKIRNDRQVVSYYYAGPGMKWTKIIESEDISGLHHNMLGGFLSVRPGIFAAGNGKAVFARFIYRPIR